MAKAEKPAGVAGTELVAMMAKEQHLDAQEYASTVMKSCFDPKNQTSPEQFMAFLMIAREHKLNPITREIYAFAKGGKVTPIVSIDGWLKIINDHPDFMGMEFKDELDDADNLLAITCKIYRMRNGEKTKTEVTEYLDECKMPTEPWKKWPARMLRHKATIQCARYAFGFSGIMDADEAQRIESIDGTATVVEDAPTSPAKRIMHKVQAKVTQEEMPPVRAGEEVAGDSAGATAELQRVEAEGVGDNDGFYEGTVPVEDIPGLKKGSELSDENKEWVEDMEKAE